MIKSIISQALVLGLFILSVFIVCDLCLGKGPNWTFITLYWVCVAVKNLLDLFHGGENGLRSDS